MNFNRDFDEWIFIRGQEYDRYRSSRFSTNIDRYLKYSIPSKVRGKSVERLLEQYFANVRDRKSEEDWFAPKVFRESIRWFEENRDAEKFFLLIEAFDPHEPWDPPHEFVDMYDPGYTGEEHINLVYDSSDYLTEKELRNMWAHYAGEVTLVDKWFGLFMEKVYELGLDKNTLIVFTSDHGHHFGEHELVGKVAYGLYPELVDIPLFIRLPEGTYGGKRINVYVQHHDLFTTILKGVNIDIDFKVDGGDILRVLEKDSVNEKYCNREYVTLGFGNYIAYIDDNYWMITDRDFKDVKLFDRKKDSRLKNNIASESKEIVSEIHKKFYIMLEGIFLN